MRHWIAVAALAASACECGEAPAPDAPDLSLLLGEGMFPSDLGTDASADAAIEVGVDAAPGPDQGPLDLAPSDLSAPDLAAPDAGDPCRAPATVELGAAEAILRAADLAGQVVGVVGTASVGAVRCDGRPCPDGGTCCQRCRAAISVDGRLPLVAGPCTATATIACVGGACEPLVCSPPAVGVSGRFVGRLLAAPPALELLRVGP